MPINLVAPDRMSDAQVANEYTELTKICKLAKDEFIERGAKNSFVNSKQFPTSYPVYGMNYHFFYDKLKYICKRINAVINEIIERELDITHISPIKFKKIKKNLPEHLWNDFVPTETDMEKSNFHIIHNAKKAGSITWYDQEVDHEQFETLVIHGYDD